MGEFRFIKHNLTILFVSIILFIMAACSGVEVVVPSTAPTPTPTVTNSPTVTPPPTDTPLPTDTPTPTFTSTPTPTPDYSVSDIEKTIYVSTDNLNVRQGASTRYDIIGKLKKGDRVTATGLCSNGWIRVEYGGLEGYVSGDYVLTETEYVAQFPTPTPDPRDNTDRPIEEYAGFTGGAFAIIDVMTGEILYSYKGDVQMYPASLTKMMTALLACENLSLSQEIAFPEVAGRWQYETSFIEGGLVTDLVSGDFSGVLREYGLDNSMVTLSDEHNKFASGYVIPFGTKFTVEEMLHALMLMSAADMADAFAWTMGNESLAAFYDMMNARAQELGMTHTYFDNAVGADDLGTNGLQYKKQNLYYEEFGKITTTANDLALLARACMRNQYLREIVCESRYTIKEREGLAELTISSSVLPVLSPATYSSNVFTAVGIKTGNTNLAGSCLALAGRNAKGKELIVIYLKGNKRTAVAEQSMLLLEYAFRKLEEQ